MTSKQFGKSLPIYSLIAVLCPLTFVLWTGCQHARTADPVANPWTSGIVGVTSTNGQTVWLVEDAFMLQAWTWKKCCEKKTP